MKVVVLGGINMDLVVLARRMPQSGETVIGDSFLTYPGGKGANQAVAAAQMGAQVQMVGRVGGDTFGQQLLAQLAQRGVDVAGVAVDPESSSGIALIHIDPSGQNRIVQVLGANARCGTQELDRLDGALEGAAALMLQLEVPLEVSQQAADQARSRGCTVILDPAPACPLPYTLYPLCDYITPNESEAHALVGFPVTDEVSASQAARVLLGRGTGCATIKLGSRGALYATEDEQRYVPAFSVEAVDTVGAGDAFNGALAASIASGARLAEAMEWAVAAGALAVTRHGALEAMPTREQVEELLKQRR